MLLREVIKSGFVAFKTQNCFRTDTILSQWKKHITTIQIGQFVLDAMLGYFVGLLCHINFIHFYISELNICLAYTYFASNYFPILPAPAECSKSGTGPGLLSGCVMATIYFFLFTSFYKDTYKTSSPSKARENRNHANKP
jgi:fatty acid elongase 3